MKFEQVLRQSHLSHPIAGIGPISISLEQLAGLWTVRFGAFGCRDDETRGAVLYIDGDRTHGGDSFRALRGGCALRGTELRLSLHVSRHSGNAEHDRSRDIVAASFELDIVAEAITADLFEGYSRRPGFPDLRVILRRLPV